MSKDKNQSNNIDNEVEIISSAAKVDEDITILTLAEKTKKILEQSVYDFEKQKHIYSRYLTEDKQIQVTTEDELQTLGQNTQDNLDKVNRINEIARYYINTNDLVGKVYDTLENNTNTEIKLNYPPIQGRNKKKEREKAELTIDGFLKSINVEKLLKKCVPLTFAEGNYYMYLRASGDGSYKVDHYGLGLIEVSNYSLDDENICIINLNELRSRLQSAGLQMKNKKGQDIFGMPTVDDEIKKNYPLEVYQAFKNKEKYAIFDMNNSGMIKINDLGRKYGVTPLFRAFRPLLMLDIYDKSNMMTAKTRAKKILIQKLSDKMMGDNGQAPFDIEKFTYAHNNLVQSFKQSRDMVLSTTPPWVSDVFFVESNTEQVDINLINNQRNKVLTALGISFLANDSKSSFNTVEVSVSELRKQINTITLQFAKILEKWIKLVLRDNKISTEHCPLVSIESSEMLDMDLKLRLADALFNKYGMSYRSTYEMLGRDYDTELEVRNLENIDGVDIVFTPRITGYTASSKSDNTTINPDGTKKTNKTEENTNKNEDQKNYDKERYDNQQ